MSLDGNNNWGNSWSWEKDKHPNEIAGELAGKLCAKLAGCGNGTVVGFDVHNKIIRNGFLRERDTKKNCNYSQILRLYLLR